MKQMIHKHTISFKHALDGVVWALKTQPNYKFHLFFSVIAVALCNFLQVSYFEFLIILLLIMVGLVIETINTAIEKTTDAISKDFHEDIKIAKDVAAGAMLIYAIGAAVVATIIFLPRMF